VPTSTNQAVLQAAEDLRRLGLEPTDRGNGHLQVRVGRGRVVNWYPASRRRCAYVNGERSAVERATAEVVARLAREGPPKRALGPVAFRPRSVPLNANISAGLLRALPAGLASGLAVNRSPRGLAATIVANEHVVAAARAYRPPPGCPLDGPRAPAEPKPRMKLDVYLGGLRRAYVLLLRATPGGLTTRAAARALGARLEHVALAEEKAIEAGAATAAVEEIRGGRVVRATEEVAR